MKETVRQVIKENTLVLLAIFFLISLTDLFFGVSQPLPDGAFNLILALLMGILGILMYWAEGEPDGQ
jgi:hypothetical protein